MSALVIQTHAVIQSLEASGAWLLAEMLRNQLHGMLIANEKENLHADSSRVTSGALSLDRRRHCLSDSLSEREEA